MPITVKEINGNHQEINSGTVYNFTIKIDGRTRNVSSYNGTLTGYNAYDNLAVVSFSITCNNGTIYYREGGVYRVLPEVKTWNEFIGYYNKSAAIYVLGGASTTTPTTSLLTSTTTKTTSLPTSTTTKK